MRLRSIYTVAPYKVGTSFVRPLPVGEDMRTGLKWALQKSSDLQHSIRNVALSRFCGWLQKSGLLVGSVKRLSKHLELVRIVFRIRILI